jgi:hypothetical protein
LSAADFERVEDALRCLGSLGINVGHDLSTRSDRTALDEEQAEGLAALERVRAALARSEETLRDRFAMAALTGLLAGPEDGGGTLPHYQQHYARTAYGYADAMLAAREVKP